MCSCDRSSDVISMQPRVAATSEQLRLRCTCPQHAQQVLCTIRSPSVPAFQENRRCCACQPFDLFRISEVGTARLMTAATAKKSLQVEPVWKTGLNYLSAWFCPFAQRTWITLEAKGVPYTLHEIALKNTETGQWFQLGEKPEWWLRLNPLGKVPVLVLKDKEGGSVRSVYESNICNEFLEDWHKDQPLLPADPVERAHARMVIDRFSSKYVPNFYSFLVRQDKQQQAECAEKLTAEVRWLEGQADEAGPFFLGPDFSLVDATMAPWFLRQPILEHYRGLRLPPEVKKLQRWLDNIRQHPAIQATQRHPEGDQKYDQELVHHYSKYADNTAKSTSAHDFK